MSNRSIHAADAAPVVVLKLGGSVLGDGESYARSAAALQARLQAAPQERYVVVVSAQQGETDRLAALARELHGAPPPATLDLLWSIGETRSVALLTLALQARGVRCAGLSVHECGLSVSERGAALGNININPLWIRHHLTECRVVVVPGFLARGPADEIRSLGRGGSDLTAVLLAGALGAVRCELIKDVGAYYSKNPKEHADAKPLARLDYASARRLAEDGCGVIQPLALEEAARLNLVILVGSLGGETAPTVLAPAASPARAAG